MHYAYLLRCADGTLYGGYTTDLKRRLAAHNSGKGAKYTRARLPVELVWWEAHPTKEAAMAREWAVKHLTRTQKLALVEQCKQKGALTMEKQIKEVSVQEFLRECVDVERFLACCAVCPNYGKIWSCPPYDFSALDVWKSYDSLLLYCRRIGIPGEMREKTYALEELNDLSRRLLAAEKAEMLEELLAMERETPGSRALSAGSCAGCAEGTCARSAGQPCRRPEVMRCSVESLGGDVGKALERYFGQKILWAEQGRLPEYFILLGGLLKKA